ncbi:superoxide dismutase family protein [Acinetobacter apis]|uniref:Superoxide dismutase [Cu-Zn] n=1 Tax=Acinetobacter apis TaxID=1229165 RepID=A0A217EG33_9GAMM|nr:superoxide dismutase family protein [Acinetobacter apis]SNQ29459.1 superoxide dismutase, Cu-Zn family [Acinetobacter apis]
MNNILKLAGLCGLSGLLFTGCSTIHEHYQKLSHHNHKEHVAVYAVSAQGVGEKIGTVTLEDTPRGLQLSTDLKKIPAGPHGFHIHEFASCESTAKNGQVGPALAAGSHLNTNHAEHHGTPLSGHLGDLPYLTANQAGYVKETSIAPRLKLADVKGHAIVVHAGGDNYSDTPSPLGGGGGRLACGVIK